MYKLQFLNFRWYLQNFALSVSVFVAYGFQFLLYCIFGELIVTKVCVFIRLQSSQRTTNNFHFLQFSETSNTLYCSQWYNLTDIKHRKLILFFLLQTTKEFKVSTYGLFELSLDTFAVVRQYYLTLLQL